MHCLYSTTSTKSIKPFLYCHQKGEIPHGVCLDRVKEVEASPMQREARSEEQPSLTVSQVFLEQPVYFGQSIPAVYLTAVKVLPLSSGVQENTTKFPLIHYFASYPTHS
jgi:hypothetical protein